jgi:hypothetical protein
MAPLKMSAVAHPASARLTLYVGRGGSVPAPVAPWDGLPPEEVISHLRAVGTTAPMEYQCLASGEVTTWMVQVMVRQGLLHCADVALHVWDEPRGQRGGALQRIRLDDRGEMLDVWPGGFFPWRDDLIRELWG